MVYVQSARGRAGQTANIGGAAFVLTDGTHWPPAMSNLAEKLGLQVRECGAVNDVFDLSYQETPVVLIVAISDPAPIMQQLRGLRAFQDTPVFALVSRESEIVTVLENGADDAAVNSSGSQEVIASRLRALLRREARREKRNGVLVIRELRLDLDKCRVLFRGRPVALTPTEFRILVCLAQRAGRVVDACALMRAASGSCSDERDAQNVIKVHIANVRRKLQGAESYILSVRGFGYLLERRSTVREADPLQPLLDPLPGQ